jgi:ABC-type branched-subunit amino acid transport system substrate-binding protein
MLRTRLTRLAAFLPVVALASASVAAPAGAEDVPGVTATQITIGGTHPYSGPASAYGIIGKGILAYFSYVNDHGGVNGRKIVYEDKDDAYNPAQTVQLVKGLVEQDHVFALFNTLGTACNLSVRQYLNDNKVPQLWVSSGATTWGADAAKYPWTIGFNVDYQAEAVVFGKSIAKTQPNAKIAVLYQNDDLGQDYLTGLAKGLGSKANQIVKQASYEVTDPDVRSQMATLQGSGADTLVIVATPKFAIGAMAARGQLNWKPTTYLTDVSAATTMMQAAAKSGGDGAVDGIISEAYTIDPTNPSLANTPGMKLYKEVLAKYGSGLDPNNGFLLYGMAAAYTMVDTLQKAGKDLTREKVMDAATHMNEKNPFLWPGVTLTTSPSDHFPIREEQPIKYTGTGFQPFGSIVDARK